jgi:hypothetical protein
MSDAGSTLGQVCSGECSNGYHCYADDGKPPGICVPGCSKNIACPTGYACETSLGVCTPGSADSGDDTTKTDAGCGCRTARTSDAGSVWGCLLFAAGVACTGRRRSARRAHDRRL